MPPDTSGFTRKGQMRVKFEGHAPWWRTPRNQIQHLATVGLLATAAASHAQTLEEVIVTAQKPAEPAGSTDIGHRVLR
jgi:hypothetical protein